MRNLKIIGLAFVLTLIMAGQALAFTDLEGCSPETRQAINELAEKQILNGYIDETFRPNDSINRAEFAKVAVLALTTKTSIPLGAVQEIGFSDVPAAAWYVKDVANALALGLMKGDAEGTFRPNDTVSHAEVLTVLVRSLGYTEGEMAKLSWPDNYLEQAGKIGLLNVTSVFNPNAACTRGETAAYVAKMLALPLAGQTGEPAGEQQPTKTPAKEQAAAAIVYDYGVVTELSDARIAINSFVGEQHSYKLAANCDWQAAKSECGVGRLIRFGVNADGEVVGVSRQNVYTHNNNEAEVAGSQIKLNGKNLLLNDDTAVLLMNSAGGVSSVNIDRLYVSTYVADLRSNDYRAPLQYVSDGKNVSCLLIGDYRGQNGQQFGFVESYGTGDNGLAVKFYGDENFYEWHNADKSDERPQVDALYAFEYRAGGVSAYPVDRMAEEIRGTYGDGDTVRIAGDICYTEGGGSFIVAPDSVIMKVSVRSDGTIYKVEYIDTVYGGDRVCVRYTKKTGSNYTGIEAAYILVIDAIDPIED